MIKSLTDLTIKKQGKNCGARSIGIKMKEIKAYMSVLELE